jgi:hypothetical protein
VIGQVSRRHDGEVVGIEEFERTTGTGCLHIREEPWVGDECEDIVEVCVAELDRELAETRTEPCERVVVWTDEAANFLARGRTIGYRGG